MLDGDYGEEQITVADGAGFAPGDGVAVWDERSGGFHTVVATILEGPMAPAVPEGALGVTFRVSGPMETRDIRFTRGLGQWADASPMRRRPQRRDGSAAAPGTAADSPRGWGSGAGRERDLSERPGAGAAGRRHK